MIYILLVLILACLVVSHIRLKRTLDDLEADISELRMDCVPLGDEYSQLADKIEAEQETEEERERRKLIEKQYTEGLLNILTYSAETRRKKDE